MLSYQYYFGILIVYCMMWIHSFLTVCRITNIVLTVYFVSPDTCILTRRRNHPCELPYYQPVPLQFYLKYGFVLYYFELIYNQLPYNVFSCMYVYVLLCVPNKDQSINQTGWNAMASFELI